jgi:hypothetical protein
MYVYWYIQICINVDVCVYICMAAAVGGGAKTAEDTGPFLQQNQSTARGGWGLSER